jgi:hypothetical protein
MHLKDENFLPLIEQFLQVAALIEAFIVKEAQAQKMPGLDVRTLLCMGRLSAQGAQFSMPSELCLLTGFPKSRISEALGRLRLQKLVQDWGAGSSDGRTRAFRITDKGKHLVTSIIVDLEEVDERLRVAMRIRTVNGRSMNLHRAAASLLTMPNGPLRP